jgi:hypothetical protein
MDGHFDTEFSDALVLDAPPAPIAPAKTDEAFRAANFGSAGAAYVDVTLEAASGPADAIGFFVQGKAGRPAFGQILWARAGLTPGGEAVQVDLDGAAAEDLGFFIIEHGAEKNTGMADGMMVHFEHARDGVMAVVCDGRRLDGKVSISASGPDAWDDPAGQTVGFFGEAKRFADLTIRATGNWPMDGAVRPWI